MKLHLRFSLGIVIILIVLSCSQTEKPDADLLMQVDREFSEYSGENGLKNAFIHYVHPEGILLRPNKMPIAGRDNVKAYMSPLNDSSVSLTWEPMAARISKSGDMGFTYGIYTMKADTIMAQGTYVSIWEKNTEGKWKYILDTGNEGL